MPRGYAGNPNNNCDLRPDAVMKDPDTGELVTIYYRVKGQPRPRDWDVGMPVKDAPGLHKFIKFLGLVGVLATAYYCLVRGLLFG